MDLLLLVKKEYHLGVSYSTENEVAAETGDHLPRNLD